MGRKCEWELSLLSHVDLRVFIVVQPSLSLFSQMHRDGYVCVREKKDGRRSREEGGGWLESLFLVFCF